MRSKFYCKVLLHGAVYTTSFWRLPTGVKSCLTRDEPVVDLNGMH